MIKFLINLATFVVCAGILVLGGYQTVQESNIDEMVKDFEVAFESTTVFPENPDDGNETTGGNTEKPDGGNEKPEDGNETPDDGNETPDDGNGNPDDGNENPDNNTLSTEEAKDAFKDLYDNHDSDFTEVKKEMVTGMISSLLGTSSGSNDDTNDDVEDDTDFDDNFNSDFSTEFNPDDFEPEEEPEEEETESEFDEIVSSVVTTYVDNLLKEIETSREVNSGASEEESNAAQQEFVEKEAEAFSGLVNIVNSSKESGEAPEDDKIVQSVDAVLNSTVCMGTVTESVETNSEFTEKVQEATQDMNEETKAEIQSKIETSLDDFRSSDDYDESKEKQYSDFASLFGITLTNATQPPVNP